MFRYSNMYKKYLSILLTVLLLISGIGVFNVAYAEGDEEDDGYTWEIIEDDDLGDVFDKETILGSTSYAKRGNIRVSIVLEEESALDRYPDLDPDDETIEVYRQELKARQDELAKLIGKEILGGKLDVVWNLTLTSNIISANVPKWTIDQIKEVDGVKDVFPENQYSISTDDEDQAGLNMTNASKMMNTQKVWSNGYTGAGSIVAIVDTGLDLEHISFNEQAFDHAIEEVRGNGKEVDLLTKAEVQEIWPSLNAASRKQAEGTEYYYSRKVPYIFNYVDRDFDVSHLNDKQGYHGSHVAGIAAANRYILNGNKYENALEYVNTQGDAPDAQVLVMKVFGKGGGAFDSDYFAAIEDAILLGADSVNLSLGSPYAGLSYAEDAYTSTIDKLKGTDLIWVTSAGNNSNWAEKTEQGILYKDGVNFATNGIPGTYATSLSVASVDNDGRTANYLKFKDRIIFYDESVKKNDPMTWHPGEYDFIYIDGFGTEAEFAAVDALEVDGLLGGKIAICNRGDLTFVEKANNAVKYGVKATIIANYDDSHISPSIDSYVHDEPLIIISNSDSNFIKTNSIESKVGDLTYYSGKITVYNDQKIEYYDSDYYKMSYFSSFGVPGDLSMKPEITAPGGSIYSVYGASKDDKSSGHSSYGNLSGTSMASPQIAGLSADMVQYIRENGLDNQAEKLGLTRRGLIQSLLMSTAVPMIEESSKSYYSILSQGAGLVDIDAAMGSDIVILMDEVRTDGVKARDISEYAKDGKVKAELGEDSGRKGRYSVSFTVNNITDSDVYCDFDASFFTQAIIDNAYLGTSTVALHPELKWIVDGCIYPIDSNYDFNDDNLLNNSDAQVILDYAAGNISQFHDMEYADLDSDGKITSHDAHLLLKNIGNTAVPVPAGSSIGVTFEIKLGNEIKAYDFNGAYVEGYIFVKQKGDDNEGVKGIDHSIPVLGYYGGWDDSPMLDYGTYLGDKYNEERKTSYFDVTDKQSFFFDRYGEESDDEIFYFGGNPLGGDFDDGVYYPERNALSNNNFFSNIFYSLIRNAAALRVTILDSDGNTVYEHVVNDQIAAFYHPEYAWCNVMVSESLPVSTDKLKEGHSYRIILETALETHRDKDGTIHWEDVPETWDIPFVVDSESPQITQRSISQEDGKNILTISARDNNYIAGMELKIDDERSLEKHATKDKKTGGDEETYRIDLGEQLPETIDIKISDYAGNKVTATVTRNTSQADQTQSIIMSSGYEKEVLGTDIELSAELSPEDPDDVFIWRSEDDSIAKVDQNGTVTGVSAGKTNIWAKSEKYGVEEKCEVEFFSVDKDLEILVEDDEILSISSFNTADLPDHTDGEILTEAFSCAAYASDGKLYLISADGSALYVKDEEGLKRIADLEADGIRDICTVPSVNGDELIAVTHDSICFINTETGDVDRIIKPDIENSLTGITCGKSDDNGDQVLLLDDKGIIYDVLLAEDESGYTFTCKAIMNTSLIADEGLSHSLYYDGGELFLSITEDRGSYVSIYYVEDIESDEGRKKVYKLGSFEPGVKVSGLHASKTSDLVGSKEEVAEALAPQSTVITKDKISAVLKTDSEDVVSLDFYNNESAVLTNGKYEIRYDASKLRYNGISTDVDYKAINNSNEGKIIFTFAEKTGEASGSKVFTVNFIRLNDKSSDVYIDEKENGRRVAISDVSYEYHIPKKGDGLPDRDPKRKTSTSYKIPVTGIDW